MTTVLTYLDSYCERAGDPTLWAEPLNAVTNAFFLLAALACGVTLSRLRAGKSLVDLYVLTAVLCAIGLGSAAWHLHPNGMTVLMDVIPITLFMNVYLISAMRRLLAFSWQKTAAYWGIYLVVSVIAQRTLPPDLWNGTVMYMPTYVTLAVLAFASRNIALWEMLGLWTLSLGFRTADFSVCPHFPYGTHFLWHTLNAYMLYRLLIALIPARRL